MIKWLTIPDETKRNAYQQVAEAKGMSAFAVEKDWWVCRTLEIIFEMDIAQHLVFKGGTSLSKAWNLIHRFSEDIDLAINREFFEYGGKLAKKEITALRKEAGVYSTGTFFDELQRKFHEKGFTNLKFVVVEAIDSDQDPRIIEIYYPNLTTPASGYLLPRVQVEVGCRSLREPFSIKSFGSLVDEFYAGREFVEPPFDVPTVNPERTFLEKLFLLHEEFHRPSEKIRVDRLSRHLYDVYHLAKAGVAESAIANKDLYQTIVAHRHKFLKFGGVDYNLHNPKSLNPIPTPEVLDAWRADYAKMVEDMIYEQNPPSFDNLIENLNKIRVWLSGVEWVFDLSFPAPKQN